MVVTMTGFICPVEKNNILHLIMKTIKLFTIALLSSVIFLSSCKEDCPVCATPPSQNVVKSGLITADETWTADNIYEISQKVYVDAGVTLTIEPGTIIKGRAGQGSLASALVITRGGKINAVGTATNPIIFTSASDNITKGQLVGTNLTKSDNQLWGGLIILGDAPISAENGDDESNIEGIPAEDGFGVYGGTNANHNAGKLKYVSIRHGGISIGEGNEINGLTLGGVGAGTEIENIEIYATLDDGIEFFGGTVSPSKLLIYYQGDDGLDIDQNYAGTITDFAVIHGDGIGTDEGLEIDGPEGTLSDGLFTLMNGICKSEGSQPSAADFKSKAQGHVKNVSFIGYGASKPIKFRTKFDGSCGHKTDAYSHLAIDNPAKLDFTDVIHEGTKVYDGDEDLGANPPVPTACPAELAAAQATAASKVSGNGAGATLDIATMFSWTAAGINGAL